jgi:hypothetical protein
MFNIPNGLRYYRFLKRLHENCLFDWYMEVGCRAGKSFAPVRGKTIAVDPFFRVQENIIQAKPALHIFQQTSDEFFASGFLARNNIELSVSFLDGMHLIEYLLRDFIATERASTPKGVILMHDTAPRDAAMTLRDFSKLPKGAPWTGDVWKIWPILQQYRPDLTLHMLDCKPTGLMMVTGLNPKSTILTDQYDEIIAQWQDVSIEDYGTARFANSFVFSSALQINREGFPMFNAVRLEQEAVIPKFASP